MRSAVFVQQQVPNSSILEALKVKKNL